MPDTDSQPDRRVSTRFQPASWTVYRMNPRAGEQGKVGLVWNISRSGLSMLVPEAPKPGESFEGELVAEGRGLPVALRVVHVRTAETGDYVVGARFARQLEQAEMDPFLAPQARAAETGGRS
jgi:hypothetical protein